MKCAIYARVSPTKRESTVTEMAKSVEEQLRLCTNRAISDEVEIHDNYIDQYQPGDHRYMKNFQRMIQDAKVGKFKRIYCRRVDRFGRNLAEMIKTEIDLHDLGVSIVFLEEGIDTSNKVGRMLMDLLSHISEWKREEIRENTRRGREKLREDIEAGRTDKKFGRTQKPLNVEEVVKMKNNDNLSWSKISKIVSLSVPRIQSRLKDAGYRFNKGKVEK